MESASPYNELCFALNRGASLDEIRTIVEASTFRVNSREGFLLLERVTRKENRWFPLRMIRHGNVSEPWQENVFEQNDAYGSLLLHVACRKSASLDVVRYLVEQNPKSIKVRDSKVAVNVLLPLHYACDGKASLEVVQYLVEKYPASIKLKFDGSLPLHYACGGEASFDVVRYLVEKHPASIKVKGRGLLPLHYACDGKASLEVIQYMVEQYPASINLKDTGLLSLHWACKGNASLEVIQYLVEKYPDSIKVKDMDQRLPLHWACKSKASLEVMQYLVEQYPASIKMECNGWLPLHLACCENASLDVVQYLVEEYPDAAKIQNCFRGSRHKMGCCNVSLDAFVKWDSRFKENEGHLPLHWACMRDAPLDVVQYLVRQNPDSIKGKTRLGQLPLHYAVVASPKLVRFLVRMYPEAVEESDLLNVTPLALSGNHELKSWMGSYSKIRWVRAGDYILLRALVDQGRASLKMSHSLVAESKRKFQTIGEWDLLEFVFLTLPEGVFAVMMSYL